MEDVKIKFLEKNTGDEYQQIGKCIFCREYQKLQKILEEMIMKNIQKKPMKERKKEKGGVRKTEPQ